MLQRVREAWSKHHQTRQDEQQLNALVSELPALTASLASNESLWGMDVSAEDPLHPRDAFWWTDQVRRLPQPARQLERWK